MRVEIKLTKTMVYNKLSVTIPATKLITKNVVAINKIINDFAINLTTTTVNHVKTLLTDRLIDTAINLRCR